MSAQTTSGVSVYSIAPMLSVRGGATAVEFYKAAFGAIEVFRVDDPAGAVVSRLSVENAEFWVADESPEHANFSPGTVGGGTVRMILTVPDPDAMFARANHMTSFRVRLIVAFRFTRKPSRSYSAKALALSGDTSSSSATGRPGQTV